MRLHAFQHVPFEGLGSIQTWVDRNESEISFTRLFQNDPLPSLSAVSHLIVLGGPMGVHDHRAFPWLEEEKGFIREFIHAGKSVLGICLGAQLVADALGAHVYPNRFAEIGWFPIHKSKDALSDDTAAFLPPSLEVFHWHGDTFDLPDGARCLAHSEACRHQGFYLGDRIIGLQFHLETTPDSMEALLAHCGDELVDSPYIQTAKSMRSVTERFIPNQGVMDALLSQWTAV